MNGQSSCIVVVVLSLLQLGCSLAPDSLQTHVQSSLPWWCPMTMVVYHDGALQKSAVATLT